MSDSFSDKYICICTVVSEVAEHRAEENMPLGCFCNIRDRKLTSNTDIVKQTKNTSWGIGKGVIYFSCFSFSLCLVLVLSCTVLTQETHKTSNKPFISCISHNTAKHFPIDCNLQKASTRFRRAIGFLLFLVIYLATRSLSCTHGQCHSIHTACRNLFRYVYIWSVLTYTGLRNLRETIEVLIYNFEGELHDLLQILPLSDTGKYNLLYLCNWYHIEVFSLTRKIYCPLHWNYCEVTDYWLFVSWKKNKMTVEKTVPFQKKEEGNDTPLIT